MSLSRSIYAAAFLVAALLFGCSEDPLPVEGDTCASIVDCAAAQGLSCLINTCQRVECERSSACPAGAACVAGVCDDPECLEDEDCSGGRCFEGDCRDDICSRSTDCSQGLICSGRPPLCVDPPEVCGSDLDCPSGLFCKLPEGQCAPLCAQESDCPGDSYCDGSFCRQPCSENASCPDDSVCFEGECERPIDCGVEVCPPGTPFQSPEDCTCRSCLADADCSEGRSCLDGVCRFCARQAESSSTCTELGFLFDGECCVECVADDDCTVGVAQTCVRGGCTDDVGRECASDGDCATGQGCVAGICRKTGSGDACQLQADCPVGEACYADNRCWEESGVCTGCQAPGRCIAEDGDTEGTCAGCTSPCDADACPAGEVCFVEPQSTEGVCIDADFTPNCP